MEARPVQQLVPVLMLAAVDAREGAIVGRRAIAPMGKQAHEAGTQRPAGRISMYCQCRDLLSAQALLHGHTALASIAHLLQEIQ